MHPKLAEAVRASDNDLTRKIFSKADSHPVETTDGHGAKDTVVEFTRGFIDVPYETFMENFNPDQWAKELANYRGGETKPFEDHPTNSDIEETWQIESILPLLFERRLREMHTEMSRRRHHGRRQE